MKRFHVHVSVENLDESIRFYSVLFAATPAVQRTDYAKWMLDDPRVNFAISRRGHAVGVNHLGFQTESGEDLQGMRAQLKAADANLVEQTGQPCCYAKSDKYWVTDPAGIAWETFHTLGSIPVFGDDSPPTADAGACCVPLKSGSEKGETACCVPLSAMGSKSTKSSCCS